MGNEELLAQIVSPQNPEFPRKKKEKPIVDWITEALGITTMGDAERKGTPPSGKTNQHTQAPLSDEDLLRFYRGEPLSSIEGPDRKRIEKLRKQSRKPAGWGVDLQNAAKLIGNKKLWDMNQELRRKALREKHALRKEMAKKKAASKKAASKKPESKKSFGVIPGSGGMGSGTSDPSIPTGANIDAKKFYSDAGKGLSNLPGLISKGVGSVAGDDWGTSIGKGMAALGDALVQGGRGKTGFLKGVLDVEEARRKEPYEKMKDFQKMLQTEIDKDRLEEDRKTNRLIKYGRFDLDEQKAAMNIPGNAQAKGVWEGFKNHPNPKLKNFYKAAGPDYYKSQTASSLNTIAGDFKIKKATKKTAMSPWQRAEMSSEAYKPYAMQLFKARYADKAEEVFNNMTSADADKMKKSIDDHKKVLTKLAWNKKELNIINRVQRNAQALIKEIIKGTGLNKASWDDIHEENGKIVHTDPQTGRKTIIDPSGFQLLGLQGRFAQGDFLTKLTKWNASDATGTAAATASLIEGIFAPLRKADFGASQSASELKNFYRQAGLSHMGTEVDLFKFLKKVITGTADQVSKTNNRIKDLPIGELYLERTGMKTRDDFSGPIGLPIPRIVRNLEREISDRKKNKKNINNIPEIINFRVNVLNALGNKALYSVPGDPRIYTKLPRGKTGHRHDSWGPSLWLKLMNKMPSKTNIYNSREVTDWVERKYK